MSQIDKLRKQIDKIDFQILDLLKRRSKIAEKIGKEKKSSNLFRPERQANILRNILKKNGNNLNPLYILSFWRSIFLSQIDVQGGIKLLLSNNIANSYIKTIYDYFSHDIEIITMNNTSKALEKVYNGKNILTILPYPSYNKGAQWWTNKRLEKLYGIAALPFFLRKKKSPSLIIVSKYKPIIEKDSYFLYISKYLIKDKNTVLISKSGKHYLYRSNNMINSNDLKLFGILPKHYED
jgi:chorismate mutase